MLEDLLSGAGRPDSVIALSPRGPRTAGDLARSAGAVARRASGGGRWLLACEDAFEFAAGLLGLLRAGCTVVIPPNLLPETLERMGAACDGRLREAREEAAPLPFPPGARLEGRLEFWTSGSSGAPKQVVRAFRELADEVAVLERLFGARVGDAPMLGTVPHLHIYGFLFRVLWPLASGRPFVTEAFGTPAGFHGALRRWSPVALVSCPAHLSRLPHLVSFGGALKPPVAVFSSGGPLEAADAELWRPWVPSGVVEIFGSTETGGVAWRSGGDVWTPFPDVSVAAESDGALRLQSPRVAAGSFRMEDAVECLPGGGFRLKGRLDRTVKVSEKRVSLPEVESALRAHPWVAKAAVVLLTEPRQMLGAAVVLAEGAPGLNPLELSMALRSHLAPRFEPAAIPKRWRSVDQLPVNAQGKVEVARIQALFAERMSA